jgi:hypothetical protein
MRADSLGGRIVGAIARDPAVVSPVADASPEPSDLAGHGHSVGRGRWSLQLRRNSVLGRIVAALARTETVFPAQPSTSVVLEEPTPDAELTILVAGSRPARPTCVSVPAYPREPVEPTSEARLGIITVPA